MSTSRNDPQVSIIIPTFNARSYIEQSVSSALASYDVSIEVIVVDDGSTDGTMEVVHARFPTVQCVRQERGGPYRARNFGARLARGEWLAFLDADDDWFPEKLSKQLAAAAANTDLIYTDRLNFGDLSKVKERQSDNGTLCEGDVFEPLLLGNCITLSSVLIRKTAFERLEGFSTKRQGVQDWDLWLRYAAEGGKVALVREPLTRYRIHPDQMSNDLTRRAADREDVLRRALAHPRGRTVPRRLVRQAFASICELAAWHAQGEPIRAIGWYLRAVWYTPYNVRAYKGIVKACIGRE